MAELAGFIAKKNKINLVDINIMCIFAACSSEHRHFICSFAPRTATSIVKEQDQSLRDLRIKRGFPIRD